jgi:nicotinamide-nucleotide adenylyltransferase
MGGVRARINGAEKGRPSWSSNPNRVNDEWQLLTYMKAIPNSITSTVLSRFTRPVELVYTPHDHWPLPPSINSTNSTTLLRISVLDSSFNPPTLAHLALANHPTYDARLLLLSVRNVDKSLGPGDASYIQRLQMMYLLAMDIEHPSLPDEGASNSNMAIAIIDEPTFIGKSSALLTFLRSRLSTFTPSPPTPRLTFLLGMDTLTRLFSPRYYPSSTTTISNDQSMLTSLRHFFNEEGSNIVCARRDPNSYPSASSEPVLLTSQSEVPPPALEFLTANRITFIDIGVDERGYSSSSVRRIVRSSSPSIRAAWEKMVSPSIERYIKEKNLYSV